MKRVCALAVLAALGCDRGGGGSTPGRADAGSQGDASGEVPGDAGEVVGSLRLERVSPNRVSTLGGETLTLSGSGFVAEMSVTLGGLPVTLAEVHDESATFTAPALPPGRADLAVSLEGLGTAVLREAVLVEPLSVMFDPAPETWGGAPEADVVLDAAPFDVEGDGDPDVVVATDDGLRVLLNDGRGQLALQRGVEAGEPVPVRPGGRGAVRALLLADLDADAAPELLGCTDAGRDLHMVPAVTGLADRGDLPLRSGTCRAMAAVRRGGAERPSLAVAVEQAPGEVGLSLLEPDATGRLLPATGLFSPPEGAVTLGPAESADAVFMQTFLRLSGNAHAGTGAARLSFALTEAGPVATFHLPLTVPLTALPEHLRFAVRRAEGGEVALHLRLVDSAGAAFTSPPLEAIGQAWAEADVRGPWTPEAGGEAMPAPPFAEIGFVLTGAGPWPIQGELHLDTLRAETLGDMPRLLDDFERAEPRHAFTSVARLLSADLDGDGAGDVLVLPAEDAAPTLLHTVGAPAWPAWLTNTVPVTGPGPFSAGALLDADRDGALDALLVSGGQDRLLVGDGWGHLLDATFGLLPVDWADGRSVVVADFNQDAIEDLLIGNRGKTDRLYLGRGDGRYLDATPELGLAAGDTAAIVAVDLENDGDLDVVSFPADGRTAPRIRIARGGRREAPME